MKRSTERILTTHTGSLPRPADLLPLIYAKESGDAVDDAVFDAQAAAAVSETVRKQADAGVDVLNDGEMSKPTYASYVKDRMSGFGGDATAEGTTRRASFGESDEFPDFKTPPSDSQRNLKFPSCDGPVRYERTDLLQKDIDHLQNAVAGVAAEDVFMSAASPGVIARFCANRHYPGEDAYLEALALAMRTEYEAIVAAGLTLQLDCPDLALPKAGTREYSLDDIERHVEVLNVGVANIPPEAMRVHVCWGNGEAPRNHDIPLRDIIHILLKLRPAGIMLMAANGAHEHEWKVFESVKLPEGKYIVPGVIDSTTNIIEHPEVVAQRLTRYAGVVGRENVIAGSDCGFGTGAGMSIIAPSIVWAKFRSMREGARLASDELW